MTPLRASGILLHPTSLPGEFGIGDLGPEAFRFVDFLIEAGQRYWQILPLGPTGFGDSPYQCFSAFAGNNLLISPEKLIEDGLITADDLAGHPEFTEHKVDFGAVQNWKNQLLPKVYEGFHHTTSVDLRGKFETFCHENGYWLDEYALFRSIKTTQNERPWYEWPDPLKLRYDGALREIAEKLFDEIQAHKFYQFLFFRQWYSLKSYANQNGIKIIGDIPIFVALDSADVWCGQDKFKLNSGRLGRVRCGRAARLFFQNGPALGQSDLRLGRDAA